MNINQTAADMIASTLARQFVSMYYVDIETGHFKQLVTPPVTGVSGMPEEGDDFFNLAKENAPSFVDAHDLDKLLVVYDKKAIRQFQCVKKVYSRSIAGRDEVGVLSFDFQA